ncbi:MAG: hypothetical protein ACOC43_14610 [Desulfohalobiaceae bacterium]
MHCTEEKLQVLLQEAKELGATDAVLLPMSEIEVKDSLARICSKPK